MATTDGVRAARRTTLNPASASPLQDLEIETSIESNKLAVKVTAVNYVHELSLLSEVVDLGTQVDSQIVSLLPGESHTFKVTGSLSVLNRVVNKQ